MNLRDVEVTDWHFVYECYADWPVESRLGPMTEDRAARNTRRWVFRDDEICKIMEKGDEIPEEPVALITYRHEGDHVILDNVVVHPAWRGRRYGLLICKLLAEELHAQGVQYADFEALPGTVSLAVENGFYEDLGASEGNTGPLRKGRAYAKHFEEVLP